MKIKTQFPKAAFAAFIAATPILAVAQTAFNCEGLVSYLALNDTGALTVNFGHGEQYLCSMSGSVPETPVTPALCKSYHTQVLAAKAMGKKIRLFYDHSNNRAVPPAPTVATSCTGFTPWSWPNPAPYHFAIVD